MRHLIVMVAITALASCGDLARVDVSDEAGLCSSYCDGDEPYCSASGACVACLDDSHCSGTTPMCDPLTHACRSECNADPDCGDAARPTCASNRCVAGCASDSSCARFATAPVCDEAVGRCRECTADTEIVRCNGNACAPDGQCGAWPRGSRDVCGACTTDVECQSGRKCIAQTFAGNPLGAYCMLELPPTGCGDIDASLFPYSATTESTSVDGSAGRFCLLGPDITCPAVLDLGIPCTANEGCGAEGLADGVCGTVVPRKCTYACETAADCDPDFGCSGLPKVCQK